MSNQVSDVNGKGVAGAIVTFYSGWRKVKTCQTNQDGYFYTNLDEGEYNYLVNAHNFELFDGECVVSEDGLELNVVLTRVRVTADINVDTEYDEYPVRNCSVRLVRTDDESETYDLTTDVNGICSVDDLKCATYDIVFKCEGYYDDTTQFEFTENKTTFKHVLRMDHSVLLNSYKVRVRDVETTQLLSGVSVTMNGPQRATVLTDENGIADFKELISRGIYSIKCSLENYIPLEETDVKVFEDDKIVTVRMKEGTIKPLVNVIVKAPTGEPVPNAGVVFKLDGDLKYSGVTGSDGVASFIDIEYAEYDVVVTYPDFEDYVTQYSVNRDSVDLEVTLSDVVNFNIITQTKDDSGKFIRVPSVVCNVFDDSGEPIASGTSDAYGVFNTQLIFGNNYQVNCSKEGYVNTSQVFKPSLSERSVFVSMDKEGEVSQTLVFVDKDTEELLDDIIVTVYDSEGEEVAKGVSVDGEFVVNNLRPNVLYEADCKSDVYENTVQEFMHTIEGITRILMTKREGRAVAIVDIIVGEYYSQNNVSDANVVLSGKETFSGFTNNDGVINFTEVPYGTYTLSVSKEGYDTFSDIVYINDSGVSRQVELTIPEPLTIRVRCEDGVVPLADITITNPEGKELFYGVTNASGDLGPLNIFKRWHNYSILAEKDGFEALVKDVFVEEDAGTIDLIMVKEDGADMRVIVKDKVGYSVEEAKVHILSNKYETEGYTNRDGELTFKEVPFGTYSLVVTHPDFNDYSDSIIFNKESTVFEVIMRDEEKIGVKFITRDTDDQIISSVRLDIRDISTGELIDMGYTSSKGDFVSEELYIGETYQIDASKLGYIFFSIDMKIDDTRIVNIMMSKSDERLVCQVFHVIEDGTSEIINPIKGAKVTMFGNGYYDAKDTNADGKAIFDGLLVGEYNYEIFHPYYAPYNDHKEFYDDGELTIKLTDSREYNPVTFKVSDDEDVLKAALVELTVAGQDYSNYTDNEGLVTFDNVPKYIGSVWVSKNYYEPFFEEFLLTGLIEITVKHKKLEQSNLVVQDDINSAVLSNVNIVLTYSGKGGGKYDYRGVTDKYGVLFLHDVIEGQYKLEAYSTFSDYFNDYIVEDLELTNENPVTSILMVWKKINNILMLVKDLETGKIIPNVNIHLESKHVEGLPDLFYDFETTSDGCIIPSIPALDYTASFENPKYTPLEEEFSPTDQSPFTFLMKRMQGVVTVQVRLFDWETEEMITSDDDITVLFERTDTRKEATKINPGIYEIRVTNDYYDIRVNVLSGDYHDAVKNHYYVDDDDVIDFYLVKEDVVKKNIKVIATDDFRRTADVDVFLTNENPYLPPYQATNPQEGVYVFEEIPEGEYTLVCTNPDLYDDYSEEVSITDDEQEFRVLMIRAYCESLDVKVEDKEGHAVSDCRVGIIGVEGSPIYYDDFTDSSGLVRVDRIHKGIYRFILDNNVDFVDVVREITTRASTMKFLLGGDMVRMISVIVDTEFDTPLGDDVVIQLTNEYGTYTAVKDMGSNFLFNDVPAGYYDLTVEAKGFEKYIEKNTQIIKDTVRLIISLKLERPPVFKEFTVVVKNKYEDLIKSAKVTMNSYVEPFYTDVFEGTSNRDGEAYFDNEIYAGEWFLDVTHEDYNHFTETVEVSKDIDSCEAVMENKEPLIIPNYTFDVKSFRESTPVQDAEIELINLETGEVFNGTTNDEGVFVFRAGINPLPCGYYVLSITKSGYFEYIRERMLCSFAEHSCYAYLSLPVNKVIIIIRDEFNKLYEEAFVVLENVDTKIEYPMVTDSHGEAEYYNKICEGVYNLIVTSDPTRHYKQLNVENIPINNNTGSLTFNVGPENPDEARIKLRFVEIPDDGDYVPVYDADYELKNLVGNKFTGKTHVDGGIDINVPLGIYTIKVSKDGYKDSTGDFTVRKDYAADIIMTRNKVNVFIEPVNVIDGASVEADSISLYDTEGNVWVSDSTEKEGNRFKVTVPATTLVPYFTGKHFSDNPSEWRSLETNIVVDKADEGANFSFKVRPIPYLSVLSCDKWGDSVPCTVTVLDSQDNVIYSGITDSEGKTEPIKIVPDSFDVNKSYKIRCTSLAGYPAIEENVTSESVIYCGDEKIDTIINNRYLNNFRIGLSMANKSKSTIDYVITDKNGTTFSGSGTTNGNGVLPKFSINSDAGLVEGTCNLSANGVVSKTGVVCKVNINREFKGDDEYNGTLT